jgi:3-hydroxyacyl-[acyl-carrier-protein] dehydratase
MKLLPSGSNAMKKNDCMDPRKVLPFSENFLLVDRLISYRNGKNIITEKLARKSEWFFKGHFPGNPVMPGHLIAESMAQTCALGFCDPSKKVPGHIVYLVSSKTRFYDTVKPGDKLIIIARLVKMMSGVGIFAAEVRVKERTVAKGKFTLVSRNKK